MKIDPKETQKVAEEHEHDEERVKNSKSVKIRVLIEGIPVTVIETQVKLKFDDHALVDGIRNLIGELMGGK